MKDYTLSKERIAKLEKDHRFLRDKRQADRIKAVIALSKGWSAAKRAEQPGLAQSAGKLLPKGLRPRGTQ